MFLLDWYLAASILLEQPYPYTRSKAVKAGAGWGYDSVT
jgi:hypothetical protein